MRHWLLKSEPAAFGIDDLAACPKKTTSWDGVRNFQARNFLRDAIKRGDQAFFYHSSCAQPGIAGIVGIVRAGYVDPTAFDQRHAHYDAGSTPQNPRWYAVDVQLIRRFDPLITLDALRAHQSSALAELAILRLGNRLSVTPVTRAQWQFVLALQ